MFLYEILTERSEIHDLNDTLSQYLLKDFVDFIIKDSTKYKGVSDFISSDYNEKNDEENNLSKEYRYEYFDKDDFIKKHGFERYKKFLSFMESSFSLSLIKHEDKSVGGWIETKAPNLFLNVSGHSEFKMDSPDKLLTFLKVNCLDTFMHELQHLYQRFESNNLAFRHKGSKPNDQLQKRLTKYYLYSPKTKYLRNKDSGISGWEDPDISKLSNPEDKIQPPEDIPLEYKGVYYIWSKNKREWIKPGRSKIRKVNNYDDFKKYQASSHEIDARFVENANTYLRQIKDTTSYSAEDFKFFWKYIKRKVFGILDIDKEDFLPKYITPEIMKKYYRRAAKVWTDLRDKNK